MALPPGFVDELRTRVSLAQVASRKVTWDTRRSRPAKGDYWAPCPFHQEKTASFHVDDVKGFFHCFGCQQKGDAITFVRETENVGFMEAVEILAGEAGMTVPAPDPEAAKKAERRKGLADVMELAVAHARLQLSSAAAREAREYLSRRDVNAAQIERFEIGFASDSRTAMTEHLRAKGVPDADIVAAGLAIKPDGGGELFDRFRGRILFPIRDNRGQAIAFGGRAMDPNARAKYLNSPETPLFDKGRALYNVARAREAAGKSGTVIVAEGYMDVIALDRAGLAHAVAPLGTAITEDQLQMLWRMTPEPLVALDGDRAGQAAAARLVRLALPLIGAERRLRFAILPSGTDPDDLIRSGGPAAIEDALAAAQPFVEMLWRDLTDGHRFESPEDRAALDARLRAALEKMPDQTLRRHYQTALFERRARLFGLGQKPQWGRKTRGSAGGPSAATKSSALATDSETSAARIRESAILYGLLNHLHLLEAVYSDLDSVVFTCDDLESLRRKILQYDGSTLNLRNVAGGGPDGARPEDNGAEDWRAVERLRAIAQVRDNPRLGPNAAEMDVVAVLREELAKQRSTAGAVAELHEAEAEITGEAPEDPWRLRKALAAREQSLKASVKSGDTGSEDDAAALSRSLQEMIDREIWRKRRP